MTFNRSSGFTCFVAAAVAILIWLRPSFSISRDSKIKEWMSVARIGKKSEQRERVSETDFFRRSTEREYHRFHFRTLKSRFFCLFENRRRKKTWLERKQQLDLFLSRTCLARNRCRCRWCFCLGCCCWRWRCCWCCHCCSSQTHVWCCQNNRGSLVMTQNFSFKPCSNIRALLACTNRWKYWKFATKIEN